MAPVGPRKPPERETDQGPQASPTRLVFWWPCRAWGRCSGYEDGQHLIRGANARRLDGAPEVLKSIAATYPLLRHIFADGGYGGPKLREALEKIGRWTLQIVKRSDTAIGFEVIPRRWVVARIFAWLGKCRRLAKDCEKTIASAEVWLLIAHIRLLARP